MYFARRLKQPQLDPRAKFHFHQNLKVIDRDFCQWFMKVSFYFSAIIIFAVSGFLMVVVSFFTEKIPRSELGGLTWSTINDPPISFGAIGEAHDHEKVEAGVVGHEGVELIDKNGKTALLYFVFPGFW